MNIVTLNALAAFPQQLEAYYMAFPSALRHWAPDSWDGMPGEYFTAIEQVCHVRDIEIEGYGPVSLRSLVHYLCGHDQLHLAGLQWLLGKIESPESR